MWGAILFFITIMVVAWIWAEIRTAATRGVNKIYLNALKEKEDFERREEETR
jgi:hypothetical protein